MKRRIWFERTFQLGLPADAFPEIRERIRGTPARLEERLGGLSRETLIERPAGAWSIQEHSGHLLDLEPLWEGRLDELLAREERLRPADLQNRKTHEAAHNEHLLEDILGEFRRVRMGIVARLDAIDDDLLAHTALHPRLEQPMTVTDLFFFVAEHDDHHLATIHQILT